MGWNLESVGFEDGGCGVQFEERKGNFRGRYDERERIGKVWILGKNG